MGVLIDIIASIFLIVLFIGFLGIMFDALKNKSFRRYIIYKNIRNHNKKKHRH